MKVDKRKWNFLTIGDVCHVQFGTRIVKKNTEAGNFYVYGGGGATFTTKEFNREDAIVVSRFALSKECTRFINGKFFLNDSGLSLEPKNDLLLFNFLKWHIFALNDRIYSLARGAAQKNLDMKRFVKISISLPKLNEQQSIASELDAIQTMIDGYKAQLDDLDELAKSIFLDMFGDVSVNDKHWNITRLGDLGALKNGINYDKGVSGIKIKFLGVGDFKDNKNLSSFDDISTIEIDRIPKEYLLENGDIVFVRSNGNKNLVGRCMEVFPNGQEVTFSGFCIRFRKSADILNKYLVAVLTDDGFKRTHIHKSNGIGIQNINQKLLSQLPIPTPSIALQQQFAAKIEAIETQKEKYKAQLADAEQLMAERMQYYFS